MADVTIELSAGVTKALGDGGTQAQKDLQEEVNATLKKMAKAKPKKEEAPDDKVAGGLREIAKDLYESDQTIKILCREEAADDPNLKDQYEQSGPGAEGGGAATKGDFDQNGKPTKNGTTIIVIECARLQFHGWYKKFGLGDTMIDTLGHELVHAANEKHVHGDDAEEEKIYRRFGGFFSRILLHEKEKLDEEREREARRKRREAKNQEKAERTRKKKERGGEQTEPEDESR
jgi:hypothetical protein